MTWAVEAYEAIYAFIERGGDVLLVIFLVTFVMLTLITERLLYFRFRVKRDLASALAFWKMRSDHASWYAKQIRRQLVSEFDLKQGRSLSLIATLVALCPLLGLLGTVSGMIEVFDVMAIAGSGNPRAMASGVSRATIPTMAGMVAALPGLYFSARLSRMREAELRKCEDALAEP